MGEQPMREKKRRISAPNRVWLLTAATFTIAIGITVGVASIDPINAPVRLRWWMLAPIVYLSELTVVHLRFRRDAHSFSMSELPLVAGLFFASPVELLVAQFVGNAAALAFNRRQPPVKLAFNLSQFSLQAGVAILIFRGVVALGAPNEWPGWVAALAATMAALALATGLISIVIRLSGGRLNRTEMLQVLGLSAIAATMNTTLALIGIHLVWATPSTAWLAIVPPIVLFMAYRAYMSQREERSRLESLYRAMRSLHEAGHIESALVGATREATDMFEAEFSEILLLPDNPSQPAYRTAVTGTGDEIAMEPITRREASSLLARVKPGASMLLKGTEEDRIRPHGELPEIEDCMIAHVRGGPDVEGVFVVANRLGDISQFMMPDVKLLETFASQVSTTLVNGQLADSLAQLTELKDELKHQALHDSLTELANRTLFTERLEQALARTRLTGHPLAVLFLDLDDFKTVNDSLGHEAGDHLLQAVAQRIRAATRPKDTVARFGGDEFAILLEELPTGQHAIDAAERIVNTLAVPFRLGDRDLSSQASIGVAITMGDAEPEQLLRDADVAMYAVKRDRKGTFRVFEPHMREEMTHRLELRADLAAAVERGDLTVHYQPIIELGSSHIAGVEALVRWRHPERGLVQPADFIPFAEETGLIIPLGQWVLDEACRQAREWQAQTGRRLGMSVNLSPSQLQDPGFVSDVAAALERHQLEPQRLTLEITENVLMHTSMERLDQIKALGVSLAIDDFGTGYSSLSYLDRLPIDIIKVDQSFVARIGVDEHAPLVRAVVQLGDSLGLRTIVEGIETMEQLQALRELGVTSGQGFYLAMPMEAEELEALVMDAQGQAEIVPDLPSNVVRLRRASGDDGP
ncbi:MAG: EAL domain-containing protein [Acidimicrobiia bacterium]|nr:EAL domain-containing protein [Acidimicrobiia bacterium]